MFANLEKIVDMVRQLMGSRDLLRRLKRGDAQRLEEGLPSKSDLDILWEKYGEHERDDVMDLLCKFDFWIRVPPRNGE